MKRSSSIWQASCQRQYTLKTALPRCFRSSPDHEAVVRGHLVRGHPDTPPDATGVPYALCWLRCHCPDDGRRRVRSVITGACVGCVSTKRPCSPRRGNPVNVGKSDQSRVAVLPMSDTSARNATTVSPNVPASITSARGLSSSCRIGCGNQGGTGRPAFRLNPFPDPGQQDWPHRLPRAPHRRSRRPDSASTRWPRFPHQDACPKQPSWRRALHRRNN